ncbi:MAG: MlaD family protein [Pseudomonadota bacterium]
MTRKASKFKVGLFVLIAVLLGVASLIWLGTSRYLKGSTTYVTYFAESVQGLQVDSVVKYRGVEVGRVKAIQVAPDNTLIEVVMGIHFQGQVAENMVATLKMVGITGIAYIELDQRRPGVADQSPKLSFASANPIIPSRPSEISQLFSLMEEVIQQARKINLKDMADQAQEALKAFRDLAAGKAVHNVVANLETASANLASLTGRADKFLANGGPDAMVADARAAAAEAKALLADLRAKLEPVDLAQAQSDAVKALDDVRRQTGALISQAQDGVAGLSGDLMTTAESLRRSSLVLERLLERLEASPSDVLFSQPPPERGQAIRPGPGR